MSMGADIEKVFRNAHLDGVSQDQCVDMFIGVIGALEWNYFDIDYDECENWIEEEKRQAKKLLFG